jgi:hypothetical protein
MYGLPYDVEHLGACNPAPSFCWPLIFVILPCILVLADSILTNGKLYSQGAKGCLRKLPKVDGLYLSGNLEGWDTP